MKHCDIFLIFAQKIARGSNNVYPCTPQFYYIKVVCKGVYIIRTCWHDEILIDGDVVFPLENNKNQYQCVDDTAGRTSRP